MRIIGGNNKGLRITPPVGLKLRPTTDFAKEALFNMLQVNTDWSETEALDLFSGTGNIAFELASRGCKSVTAVEKQKVAHDFIRRFSNEKKITLQVFGTDMRIFMRKNKRAFDLVFADPPYDLDFLDQLPELIWQHHLVKPNGLLVIEHGHKNKFEHCPEFIQQRQYGAVHFSLFRRKI